MRLDQIPEDILILICTNLCFHCQNTTCFVNADATQVVRDKKTLAYLCRSSKSLRNVAQPILYHYYATGNLEKGRKRWSGSQMIHGPPWEYDFLPQFLRTIMLRPELAVRVKTLQMIPHRALWYGKTPESKYEAQSDVMELLLRIATERKLLPWRSKRRNCVAETPLDHDELILVGLQCMPRVHTLLLARSHPGEFDDLHNNSNLIVPPLITFPSLKTVGLIRASNDYNITELADFFCAATNIETLYACDGGGWSTYYSGNNSKEGHFYIDCVILGLLRLRKLVIDSLSTVNASDLIGSLIYGLKEAEEEFDERFPGLEDLEYYWDGMATYNFSLDGLLWPLTDTLKRLCLAYLPRSIHALHDWDDERERELSESDDEHKDIYGPPTVDYDPISSLATFTVLTDVSLDCRSIYRPQDPDTSARLVTFLPPTVARLRVTYTFRGIANGLYQLASQAPKDFPSLKEVVIGVPSGIQEWCAEGVEATRKTGDVFEKACVRFVWTIDKLGADSRTMIPGGPAGSSLVPVPGLGERKLVD